MSHMDPRTVEAELIRAYAQAQIPIGLLHAVISVESAWDILAHRTEPAFYQRYIQGNQDLLGHRWYLCPRLISASYGLMQIMHTTALWWVQKSGFPGLGRKLREAPWLLFEPDTNLKIGSEILGYKMHRYGAPMGILAYNGGQPQNAPLAYLRRVVDAWSAHLRTIDYVPPEFDHVLEYLEEHGKREKG